MQRSISGLFEPSHDPRARTPTSRAHTPTTDDNVGRDSVQGPPRDPVPAAAEETALKKLSTRKRLDGLSIFRISASAITFTSGKSGGSGGKADVARATVKRRIWSHKRVVAVKKLRCNNAMKQPKFSREFLHEVEVMAGLSHENIVRFIGFVEDLENGKAWIVLSWEPNGNISEFLATGEWEIPERVSLIQDTFEGVKYLHTREPPICHGDLKSFNILVSSTYRAIITDFGSARAITEPEDGVIGEERGQQAQDPKAEQTRPQVHVSAVGSQLTLTGPAWSLRWAPPEVVNGKRPGLSTDIWAAGWVCWEAMTGKIPFPELSSEGAITLRVIQGEVPSTLEDAQLAHVVALCSLMTDCWAFNSEARPNVAQCCTELKWIPSIPPSDGKASGRRIPSIGLLLEMGWMHAAQSDYAKAIPLFQEALSLARSAGDQTGTAKALRLLGDAYSAQTKYTCAEDSYIRAQEIYAPLGDDLGLANTLHGLGNVYRLQSKYSPAEDLCTRAQEIYARIGDNGGRADTLVGLGEGYRAQSKYTQAEESYTLAQEIYARAGDDLGRANALNVLGEVYRLQSKYTEAEESYIRAHEIYIRLGNSQGRANVQLTLGRLRRKQSRNAEAALHYAEAKDLYAQIGSTDGEERAARWLEVVSPKQNSSTP